MRRNINNTITERILGITQELNGVFGTVDARRHDERLYLYCLHAMSRSAAKSATQIVAKLASSLSSHGTSRRLVPVVMPTPAKWQRQPAPPQLMSAV